MAAMTQEELDIAAAVLARKIFPSGIICDLTTTDLANGIKSIDDDFEGNASLLNGALSVMVNINNNLPDPFKTNLTVPEKAIALGVWAKVKFDA